MVKDTTKIQLTSLVCFATALKYKFNGKSFENKEGNKVKLSRMAELHNNKLFKSAWKTLTVRPMYAVKIGSDVISAGEVFKAQESRLVRRVCLQQKRDGSIIVQQHRVEFAE